ncbi:FtsX-like permease family protein [Nocardia sp. GTS18]|uniref:FtsX-like permease family protein n=1 Tax=Nocardia sp. GTS18 TaxID=1778064 RepID=UPI0015EF3F47|nr:FtsX-like permease family protein [Nocardia sp. GTS18]
MSNLMAVKVRRDLRANWSRLILMVVAIAVSLMVFGGVLCGWATTGRETSAAYMSTEPASATILLDKGVSSEAMAALVDRARTEPGISEAVGRTQFDSEFRINDQYRDIPIQVFVAAPDDPMRMAKSFPQQGNWPPAADEIYLGKDALELMGAAIGDTVTVTWPSGEHRADGGEPTGGTPVKLRVADTVYDPSLSPSPQEQRGRGYVSAAAVTGSPVLFDQVKVVVTEPGQTEPSRSRDAITAVASRLSIALQRDYGVTIREVQVPPPYAHPHQWQADSLLLSLLAGGGAALLLSTILVASMLNNLFTQQIPQIGIMKAIGASSARIGRAYLVMVLIVAAAATAVALPVSALIGKKLVTNLLEMLGIEAASLAAPAWTYAVIILVGLALPLLIALIPLLRASRITVRAAIDHHGGTNQPSRATGLLAGLGRIPGLNRGLIMALRNTFRRPARFALSVGLLAAAGMVFVAGMSLSSGVNAVTEQASAERIWDVEIQLAQPTSMDRVRDLLRPVADITHLEGMANAKTGVAGSDGVPLTRTYPDQGHGSVSVRAAPADATLLTLPKKIIDGRWLEPGETGSIVLNQITRNNTLPGVRAGDTVQLSVGGKYTTWQVVGIAEETGHGSGVYATAEGFAAAMGTSQLVNTLRIATTDHSEDTRGAVAMAVGAALTDGGVTVEKSESVSRANASSAGHMGPLVAVIMAIAIAMGVVGAIGLASTMSANIIDRTREFGVMHAIGAQPSSVRRIVVAEGVFLALASCLVAALPALALTALLGNGLGTLFFSAPLPFRVSLPAVIIWIVLAVLGAALATEAAASRASRITVREALAYL